MSRKNRSFFARPFRGCAPRARISEEIPLRGVRKSSQIRDLRILAEKTLFWGHPDPEKKKDLLEVGLLGCQDPLFRAFDPLSPSDAQKGASRVGTRETPFWGSKVGESG